MTSNTIFIVFDDIGMVYGVYEEGIDADERAAELSESEVTDREFSVEMYELNVDVEPEIID